MFVCATISTDNKGEVHRLDSAPSLRWLQEHVGPGGRNNFVELVHSQFEGHHYTVYVDEEGMLRNLPLNTGASLLYAGPSGLRGNAIVCGEIDLFKGVEASLNAVSLNALINGTQHIVTWEEN